MNRTETYIAFWGSMIIGTLATYTGHYVAAVVWLILAGVQLFDYFLNRTKSL
jgi:hypothetical protein